MPATFQDIILKLQNFWAARGCLIWQPYYTQVGAGTMNPATFLRVLGPEPWNVAYVEPSVRPDDGRYGENPNRFQVHYQYQVILKPDPGNPQELYLESLKALGIDPRQHDIRFVEDNWEQPAIAAWGLGWEVWLDGQEITQFTYFQQVGGLSLEPVAVEITYGLERILIALNNAKAIWDEPWGDSITYGEIRRREEFEHSKYYFEIADVPRIRTMYDLFKAEAEAALANGLVLPAHDYLLKCSHTFNILDTRGAIGVTERQLFFREMRDLARRVAEAYLEQRKALGYPLLRSASPSTQATPAAPIVSAPSAQEPRPCLLEIGTEELPPADVEAALAQLRQIVPQSLDELHIPHGSVQIFGTPRRISVLIEWVSPLQERREEWVRGPQAEKAFDPQGKPTAAALGFARKMGVAVEELVLRQHEGSTYVFACRQEGGRPTLEVLAEAMPRWIASLKFEKSMRWRPGDPVTFPRPIRWLVALLGDQVIPFEYAGITSGNLSRGLRPHGSPVLPIPDAASYLQRIAEAGILLDPEARRASIREQVEKLAVSAGGRALIEDDLLQEVTHLVESPFTILGSFDPEFLSLPRAVLISVMRKHQRYFPVLSEDGERLLPSFIVIRNGDGEWSEMVQAGNEHVLAARFTDAAYFVREDRKQKLETFRPRLSQLTFQAKLGSMLEKSERLLRLTPVIASMLLLTPQEKAWAERAAFLAKADLVTQMVTEMTSLQGIMGREYALSSDEAPEVAEAIGEQYQTVPRTRPGLALALADRLDSLCGLFAVGLMPSGSKDPFALRRAALGVVQPLLEYDLDFDLRQAIAAAAAIQPLPVSDEVQKQVLEFLSGRLRVLLQEEGYRYDVVEAVLAEQAWNPAAAHRGTRELQMWVQRPDWPQILPAYARCVRILRAAAGETAPAEAVNEAAFREEAEEALYKQLRALPRPHTVSEFLEALQHLVPAINAFFEAVLVMAEEEELRRNRLALVKEIASLSTGLADLSKLEGF